MARCVAALVGEVVADIRPAGSGANSHAFRVTTPSRTIAVKHYLQRAHDSRDRLGVEWRALTFLRSAGFTNVPLPIACDDSARLLLTDWIDGVPVTKHGPQDLDLAVDFMRQVFASSARPEAASLPLASEACLSVPSIIRQIERRLASLASDPAIDRFVSRSLGPRLAVVQRRMAAEIGDDVDLPLSLRRLIPADFGFHNALRAPDGRLHFVDFDYFGWDDPVKLAADVILHPAMTLTRGEKLRVIEGLAAALPHDTEFSNRLARHRSLYALRWALIVLNPFRHDRAPDLPTDVAARKTLLKSRLRLAQSLCEQVGI